MTDTPDLSAKHLLELIRRTHSSDGCGCIKDMPGDSYTCTAHQELYRIALSTADTTEAHLSDHDNCHLANVVIVQTQAKLAAAEERIKELEEERDLQAGIIQADESHVQDLEERIKELERER